MSSIFTSNPSFQIHRNECDVGVVAFYQTLDRSKVVDFSIELERVTYEFLQPKINTLRFIYLFFIFQQHFAYSLTQAWSKVGHFLGGLLQSPVAGHFGMPMFLLINLYVLYFLDMRFIISLAQI